MGLEGIMLNEINQTQADKYHKFSLICRSSSFLAECRMVRVKTEKGGSKTQLHRRNKFQSSTAQWGTTVHNNLLYILWIARREELKVSKHKIIIRK
jgi:hypothetical protein